jgi:hypothetical protein
MNESRTFVLAKGGPGRPGTGVLSRTGSLLAMAWSNRQGRLRPRHDRDDSAIVSYRCLRMDGGTSTGWPAIRSSLPRPQLRQSIPSGTCDATGKHSSQSDSSSGNQFSQNSLSSRARILWLQCPHQPRWATALPYLQARMDKSQALIPKTFSVIVVGVRYLTVYAAHTRVRASACRALLPRRKEPKEILLYGS